MVEVKCTKIQYNMLIEALSGVSLHRGKCFMRKDEYTCPAVNGKPTTCEDCLTKNIKRVDKIQKEM